VGFPKSGKTGAAILAADYILARKILVVTTASGRGVWRRAFPAWSALPRAVRVIGVDKGEGETDVAIISWGSLVKIAGAFNRRPDVIILDEDQRAVSPEAKRTERVYGRMIEDGLRMLDRNAIVRPGDRVWHLSGLPMPHDLGQCWARLRASFPEKLQADPARALPDVTTYTAFKDRYTVSRSKRVSYVETIQVVFGGRNEPELRMRLEGTFLRRTQKDVGIQAPRYDLLPLIVTEKQRAAIEAVPEHRAILEAAEQGLTRDLDVDLGTLRRVTGTIKAAAVVDAVKEEFSNGVTKIVLAYWHRDVGDVLEEGLKHLGALRLDGSTPPKVRETLEAKFRQKKYGVFLAQIKAAGEAIDLSPADEMWCVETSTSPGDMDQVSKRITNVAAQRLCFIRVVTLAGTIDEALQMILTRLWAPIREVLV
jgi:hypothetical protein